MSRPIGAIEGIHLGTTPWTSVTISTVSVTTTATAIPTIAAANRAGLAVWNPGATTVFLGSSTVGTTNDVALYGSGWMTIPFTDQITLYGITSSGSQTVTIWEFTV